AAWRRRREPDALAVLEAEREKAAAHFGIRLGRSAVRNVDAADVGQRDVDVGLIRGRAPLHAAVDPALADARLPQDGAVPIGINGMDDARFLACDERAPAAGERDENWRRREIEIRTVRLGAVRRVLQAAR